MFRLALPLLLLSSSAFAQAVDFDREFPLSEADLFYPIGQNGELPSEVSNDGADYAGEMPDYMNNYQPDMGNIPESTAEVYVNDDPASRFVEHNAEMIYTENQNEAVDAGVYEEPTMGLGFQPKQIREEEASVRVQPLAETAQTFSINELPTTGGSEQPQIPATAGMEQQLNQMEAVVEKMEQSIESIINANQITEAESDTARPLVEFPSLVEKSGADVESIGLISNSKDGFPKNVWESSDRASADAFFDKVLKADVKSPAIRAKLVELLLTRATPPKGEADINWLASRVNVLNSMGEATNAGLMISSAGLTASNVNLHKGMAQPWAESMLLQGRVDEVCGFIKQNILNADGPFWRKALLTCQLLNRDMKGLELSANMLSQEQRREDPLLFSLFDTIMMDGEAPLLSPEQKLSPLHAIVYAQSPKMLTPNVVPLLPDVVLRRIAKNVALPQSVRIQSAEVLVNSYNNNDDIALLGLLYNKVEFDDKIVASPGVDRYAEEEVDGSIARALLWQGSSVSGLSSTRALTLKAFWERAERDELFNLAAKVSPSLRKIKPSANLAWLSPEVIVRNLRTGHEDIAKNWWSPLKSNKSLSRDLSAKRDNLKLVFAFSEGKISVRDFNKWLEDKSLFDDVVRNDVQRTLSYLEASEITFPDDVWQKLYASSGGTFTEKNSDMNTLWLRLLGSQLEKQNTAGAFMLLVEPFLKDSMDELSEQTATNIVTGFKFLGMDDIARHLVFEDMLALDE